MSNKTRMNATIEVLSLAGRYELAAPCDDDCMTDETVEVIGHITIPVRSRKGDPRVAVALITAAPGCFHDDVIEAFRTLIAAPTEASNR